MNIAKIRKHARRTDSLGALMTKNPVLVMGLDLPFVIVTSTSLRNAAAMSLEMYVIHIGTMLVAMLTCRYMKSWGRTIVNVVTSTMLMVLTRLMLVQMSVFSGITDTLGIYIYLMAVNGMTLVQANTLSKKVKLWPVLQSAFLNATGFALSVCVVSLFREYFGAGTLWNVPVPVPFRLEGLLIPFAGFILVGFLLAGARFLNKRLLRFSVAERIRREERFSIVD